MNFSTSLNYLLQVNLDGEDGPLSAKYCGENVAVGEPIDYRGILVITFISDGSVGKTGFNLTVTCKRSVALQIVLAFVFLRLDML